MSVDAQDGPLSFLTEISDAELLATVLFGNIDCSIGTPISQAEEMLREAGSLCRLLAQDPEYSTSVHPCYRMVLHAALELARRYYFTQMDQRPPLESPQATRTFLISRLRYLPYEVFCMISLDARGRLVKFQELFRGSIDGCSVHIKEVVRDALKINASSVIFAHNHPSGVAEPSLPDQLITKRLKDALALMDVRVLDHLIVSGASCISFCEKGLL
jgi:DNA repair protein RadC